MSNKFGASDFFDFGDADKVIGSLKKVYEDLIKGLEQAISVSKEFEKSYKDSLKGIAESSKGLDPYLEKNQKNIVDNAKQAEAYAEAIDKLRAEQKKNEETISKLTKEVEKLNKAQKKSTQENKAEEGSLVALNSELKEARKERDKIAKSINGELNPAYQKASERVAKLEKNIKSIKDENRLLARSFGAADQSIEKLRVDLIKATKEFDRLSKEERENEQVGGVLLKRIQALDASLVKLEKSTGRGQRRVGFYTDALRGNAKQVAGFTAGLGGAFLGVQGFSSAVEFAIRTNVELSDSFADVRKTTGLSEEGIKSLSDKLRKLDTRTALSDLLEISQAAGRLGIGAEAIAAGDLDLAVKQVSEFTESVDKVFIALGDDLEGSADEIATTLGKIAGVFGLEEQYGSAEAIERIGSAVNDLAQNTKATAVPIVDITKRLQGIASVANISSTDILGLGATLDILGQRSESSSTAVTSLFTNIGSDIPKFAGIAGKSVEEFSKIIEQDANEAFALVLEGANNSAGGFKALTETLSALGIDSKRAGSILTALTKNTDVLRDAQERAAKAFEKNVSITEEFDIKNNNLAASVDKLKKSLVDLSLDAFEAFTPLFEAFGKLSDTINDIAEQFDFLNQQGEGSINFFELFTVTLNPVIDQLQGAAEGLNTLAQAFLYTIEKAKEFGAQIPAFFNGLSDSIAFAYKNILGLASSLNDVISSGFSAESISKAKKAFEDFSEGIVVSFNKSFEGIEKESGDAINKIVKKVEEGSKDVASTLTDQQIAQIKQYKKLIDNSRQFTKELSQAEIDALDKAQKKLLEKAIALNARMLKAQDELSKFRLERENKLLQELADNEDKNMFDRIGALRKISANRIQIAVLEKDALLRNEDLLADERTKILEEFNAKVQDIEAERSIGVTNLIEESGLTDLKSFDPFDELANSAEASQNKILSSFKAVTNRLKKEEEKRTKNSKEQTEVRKEIEQAAFDFSIGAINGLFESQQEALELNLQALELQKAKELELAGSNEEAKADIEEKFAEKEKKLKERQAKATRNEALYRVAVDTIVSIAKTLAQAGIPAGLPLAAIAAAQGAALAVSIAAKPLPAFAEGVKGFKGGEAVINEEGIELIKDRKGNFSYYDTVGPTLVDLPAGVDVIPHKASKDILFDYEYVENKNMAQMVHDINIKSFDLLSSIAPSPVSTNDIQQIIQANLNSDAIVQGVKEAVGSLPIEQHIWNERGYHRATKRKNGTVVHLNTENRV